ATQDAEDSQLVDLLTALLENPLDLNAASVDELTQIPGVTPIIAFNIVTTREVQRFTSVDELLRVEGVTEELFLRIRQFVRVKPIESESAGFPVASFAFRSRTTRDLQDRRGFSDGSFRGSALKVYNRFTARSLTFGEKSSYGEIGLLTEKDAGENSFTNFLAGYVHLNVPDYSTRLILGDFIVESAEGLVFWRSIGFSKGSEVISTVKKGGVGIRPYLSTDENWYFRGVAAQVNMDYVTVNGFYSSKPLHATVNSDGTLTSFYTSGLFRTDGELQRRSSSHAQAVGGKVTLSPMKGLRLGGSGYQATFENEVAQTGSYGFHGRKTTVVGLDFMFTRSNLTLF
ncbi:MAG: ComEA family DNA-binding protein, partial [Bacteroidota bacterium]